MKKLFLIFSHRLTKKQINDAKKNLCVTDFIYLPENLQQIWSNIEPELELNIDDMQLIINWLVRNAKNNDIILIQGDFGATFYIVDYCIKHRIKSVYSTTKREVKEISSKNGNIEKTLFFRHIQFREYRDYSEK